MILIDVNLLVIAMDRDAARHPTAKAWLEALLQSEERVGLPWAVVIGFVRVATLPKVLLRPMTLDEALAQVNEWLALEGVSIVHPTSEHDRHFAEACRIAKATGNLVTDAHLAALAMEHDCELASSDSDFAKFPGLRWFNPLDASSQR